MTNTHDRREQWTVRCALRRAGDETGQALVELALLLPVLMVLLIGAAEFGRLAYAAIEVSNAARAGVAYGGQNHITASDIPGMKSAATNDGSDIIAWKPTGLSATASNSCACGSAPSSAVTCSTALATCAASRVLETVQVNTTAIVNPLFHVPGLPQTYTLNGQAIMRVEQ